MSQTRLYWTAQLVGWAVIPSALVGVTALASGGVAIETGLSPLGTAYGLVLLYAVCVGGSHVVHLAAERSGWFRRPGRVPVLRIAPVVVVVGILSECAITAVSIATLPLVDPAVERSLPGAEAVATGSVMFSVLLAIWALAYGLATTGASFRGAERDRLRLEAALANARTEALERQLNPHFLFNALNTVRSLVTVDPLDARHAVTLLSAVLRRTLTSGRDATHSLADELDLVEAYLEIETMRFRARLQARVEATPEARATAVPALMVQSLVENAVKHGVAQRRAGGEVAVSASVADGDLVVTVTNPLPVASNGVEPEGTGTGLANARERLALAYGDRADLSLHLGPDVAVARLALPAVPVTSVPATAPRPPAPVVHA